MEANQTVSEGEVFMAGQPGEAWQLGKANGDHPILLLIIICFSQGRRNRGVQSIYSGTIDWR